MKGDLQVMVISRWPSLIFDCLIWSSRNLKIPVPISYNNSYQHLMTPTQQHLMPPHSSEDRTNFIAIFFSFQRARDLFFALWIPDLFMRRVESDEMWSLMCPNECPGLQDCWGEAFDKLYERYLAASIFQFMLSKSLSLRFNAR